MPTVQLAAVMFCDAVASTDLLVRLGDRDFDARRHRFETVVRRALARHRGRLVKTLGDGALATFDAVSDSVAAAVAIQHGVSREARGALDALAAHIGISAGEVTVEDGDVFGTTVVEASRLCDAAPPGAVFVSGAAAALTRQGPAPLRPLEPLAVKGFPEPLVAFSLEWAAVPDLAPPALGPELPAPLRPIPAIAFVPRPDEWQQLEQAWAAVREGGRHAVFVRGQPGAGKTRLVAEFARQAAADGATVLFGACREDGGPPFAPVVDALEHLLAHAEALGIVDADAERARSLLQVAADDELPTGLSWGPDPRAARFQAVTDLLVDAGERAPVLFVLDDLQWAGRPTLQLLLHWLRASAPLRCCFVATHRETRADRSDAFDDALNEIHRLEGVTRIAVSGFDDDGVAAFVEAAAGAEIGLVPPRVVGVLAEQTDGNPFLLGELWRHFVETGALVEHEGLWTFGTAFDDFDSPDSVRVVVARRLDRLPDDARALLEVAAVIGPSFGVDRLAETTGSAPGRVLELLEPAIASATVEALGPTVFRFTHAIVQRALYDRLSAARRAALHLDVAHALERRTVDARALSDLARHYAAAVPVADAATAVEIAGRAADVSMRAFAFEDAADLLQRVLPLVSDPVARADILLRIAEAELPAGDAGRARERALEAVEIARATQHGELLVRAALCYEEASWRLGLLGTDAERLVREALPYVADDVTRVRALAARGRALALSGDESAADVIESAIAAARELGDRGLLLFTLSTWFNVTWDPDRYALMLDRAFELRLLCAEFGDPELETHGQQWFVLSLLLNAQFEGLRDAVAEHTRACMRSQQPFHRHLNAALRSTVALMEGRFADAEQCAEEAADYASGLTGVDVSGAYGVQMFSLRREQGRLEEMRPIVEAVSRLERAHAAWRPGLAAVYAEIGLLDEARDELRVLVSPGLPLIAHDALYLATLTYLADAITIVGDRYHASAVYAALEPYRGTVVVVGHLIACYGAVDRYLGSLSETAGRARDAERHYVRAIELDTAAGAPTWLAHSRFRYARFLARQGRRDGPQRALALLELVLDTARTVGMPAVERQAAALASEIEAELDNRDASPEPATPADQRLQAALTPREREILDCLVDGLSNADIGRTLHISANTAANHVRAILIKTGCANRTEVATWAVRHGIVTR